MWGFSKRGVRLGDHRRPGREFRAGLVRGNVRGPVEHAVVELEGELDFTNAEAVCAAILASPHDVAVIDIAGIDFIDSEGVLQLQHLVGALEQRRGDAPSLTGMQPAVQRTFSLVEASVLAIH